ncbi:MAG: pantoate--beta-alanine ligase [Salinibacterium sp.]|nr:pantoate--beta-alanine ligase [Salinibacterium sp.]
MSITVAETAAELRLALGSQRVALVPTMGALHAGHLALVARASELVERGVVDTVVVSIFVNPLQFARGEDLDAYPQTRDEDLAALSSTGVGFAFLPTAAEMYPNGVLETRVTAGAVGELFEGASRAGHFEGVLTAVAKLVNIARAHVVVFGQKDAQQVFLVERMVRELSMPTQVLVVETVREHSGLALSSRNRYLNEKEHRAARVLSLALEAAVSSADRGIDAVLAAAQSVIMGERLVKLDYLAIVNPATFRPVDDGYRGHARVLIAASVGSTRLIDNEAIRLA